jgi:chromosome segregation protein
MLSRLKTLELQGYKTFANRTVFEFPGAVTAIVGPNGSGKSNITDALRWVLGEQSYTLLRGKKTEDMIFAGSERRTRSGMASATVILDNSDNWLPIDFREVSIARRAYRDGSNEYLLNGQRVRLRDVSELLSESGLAERTYTIIGQGLVDAALALRAEDRRRLFEEAAGIGLHRSRREESVRRLEETKRNLERVEDILNELRPRLNSLQKQAQRALEHEQAIIELRSLLREWYGYHWHQAQKNLSIAQEHTREQEERLEEARERQAQIEREINKLRENRQELREVLAGLHRQSAEEHLQRENISRELAVIEERVRGLHEQVAKNKLELTQATEKIELLGEREKFVRDECERLFEELTEVRGIRESVSKEYESRRAERERIETALANNRQSLIEATSRHSDLKARLTERNLHLVGQRQSLSDMEVALSEGKENLKESEFHVEERLRELRSIEKRIKEIGVAKGKIGQQILKQRANRDDLIKRKVRLEADLAKNKAQHDVLIQAKHSYAAYSDGAKILLEATEGKQIKGARGALGSRLDVPEKFEIAIGAVLGEYLDAIIFEDQSEIDLALSILERNLEKGAILPLECLVPGNSLVDIPVQGRVYGIAKDLISAPDDLSNALKLLLGDALIVHDRNVANEVLSYYRSLSQMDEHSNLRIVTLQGEVFHIRGPIRTSSKSKPASIRQRRQELEVSEEITKVKKDLREISDQISILDDRIGSLEEEEGQLNERYLIQIQEQEGAQIAHRKESIELDQIQRDIIWKEDKLSQIKADILETNKQIGEKNNDLTRIEQNILEVQGDFEVLTSAIGEKLLDDLQAKLAHSNTRIAVLEQAITEAQSRYNEHKQSLEEAAHDIEVREAGISEIQIELSELDLMIESSHAKEVETAENIENILELLIPTEEKLEKTEKDLIRIQDFESKERLVLNQAEHHYTQARIAQVRKQEALDALQRRVEVDFGLVNFEYIEDVSGPTPLPMADFIEDLPLVEELSPQIEEALKSQRALLRRIGPINPEAQVEYKEVNERYEFLTSQVNDLQKAAADIGQVIKELDHIMELEFCKTFEAVAEEFHLIFSRLFGGGTAKLILTDVDDLTNTGIDIEARLPGRREQGLSLLSGGERSLTAVALVFALLRVSPTPFCVLDEVDAMLDEANVGRFRDLLQELSRSTQFILITHNRATVQVADIIYGVTMGRDSTSQVLSLKIDELEKVV